MRNLDLISQRILIIAISISMVFASASLFFFSMDKAVAQKTENNAKPTINCDCDKYEFHPIIMNRKEGGQFMWYLYIFNKETGGYTRHDY